MRLYVYVEGGGDSAALHARCREGFHAFLRKAGMSGREPRIVACGSRQKAYDKFCTALRQGTHRALLLVDSEEPVTSESPWAHLGQRPGDGWLAPNGATDGHCHFMVQCMESWFLADRESVAAYFGAGFNTRRLPAPERPTDGIGKEEVYLSLARATEQCKPKGRYTKGHHGFDLLALIDPAKVMVASAWARRFIAKVRAESGS